MIVVIVIVGGVFMVAGLVVLLMDMRAAGERNQRELDDFLMTPAEPRGFEEERET